MTSANVANIMQTQNLVSKVSKLSEEIGTSVDFSEMLVSNSGPNQKYEFKAAEIAKDLPETSSSITYEKQQSQSIAKQEKVASADDNKISDEKRAELKESSKELDSEVKETISKDLDVSEEEVEKAMEALGFTVVDLLDPANLAQLVTELTGGEDVSAVLLSEAFTEIKADISSIFSDFAANNNMQTDDFIQIMTQLLDTEGMSEETVDITELLPNLDEAGPLKGASDDAIASGADTIESAQITQHVTKTDSEGQVEVEEVQADGKETVTVVNTAKTDNSDTSDMDQSEDEQSNNRDLKKSMTFSEGEHTVISAQADNHFEIGSVSGEALNYTPQINPEELIEQLVERTKVSFNNQETSIEMILNPEELGKLLLKVAEDKNGQMAASITVQNEDVKEALAQQMVLLKDSLNEQGIKIDAIEVTVSAHEFEENLDNQFNNDEKQGEEAERQANVRRSINLNDMDSLAGLMTEEEMLVATMMADQGNTVNLTA